MGCGAFTYNSPEGWGQGYEGIGPDGPYAMLSALTR